jgi:hypothetical protein
MQPTYTPAQQQDNLRRAVDALRANPLKAIGSMQTPDGGRCCLCVLAHVAEDIDGVPRGSYCLDYLPKARLSKVFGLPNSHPIKDKFNFKLLAHEASFLNDGDVSQGMPDMSHKQIAHLIEKQYIKTYPIILIPQP